MVNFSSLPQIETQFIGWRPDHPNYPVTNGFATPLVFKLSNTGRGRKGKVKKSGRLRLTPRLLARPEAPTLVLYTRRLLYLDREQCIAVFSYSSSGPANWLFLIHLEDGAVERHDIPGHERASHGAALGSDGNLYTVTHEGRIHRFEAARRIWTTLPHRLHSRLRNRDLPARFAEGMKGPFKGSGKNHRYGACGLSQPEVTRSVTLPKKNRQSCLSSGSCFVRTRLSEASPSNRLFSGLLEGEAVPSRNLKQTPLRPYSAAWALHGWRLFVMLIPELTGGFCGDTLLSSATLNLGEPVYNLTVLL
ncbi:MAG: hypothetical protein HY343_12790 [Lentisphaerae bacterium]|nr:hypothetical protein [Lentisphaerota bacterium]